MRKDIKTKVRNNVIKEKQSQNDLSHYIKESRINTKDNTNEKEESKDSVKVNAQRSAVNSVEQGAEITIYESHYKTKELIKNKTSKKSKNVSHRTFVPKKVENTKISALKAKQYEANMKSLFAFKERIKAKDSFVASQKAKFIIDKAISFIQTTFIFTKRVISSFGTLLSAGTGAILLIVVSLFIGVFASLSDNTVYGASFAPLSDEVLAYTDTITEYAIQYDIEEYVALIQAIMMVETKGLGNDPMDAGRFINQTISDPNYSIEVGVKYIANCLNKANVNSPSDTKKIYLVIQGYDFKDGYIKWALDNFNGYSKSNAQIYLDEFLSSGDVNYVNHVMQYIGFGFGNFRLEPNFDNTKAWGYNNPYSRARLYGQCTWFAWGRFYELYGYSPGFTGDGWNCAKQLVRAHPDKFELSSNPQVGSIFSCIGRNHVGIVVGWDGKNITIQEGNLDGKTNTFAQAKSDWQTVTYEINYFRRLCDGVIFANRK